MELIGNPVDDVLIRNFNRLHYGVQNGIYRPNATKARRAPESLYESVIRNSSNNTVHHTYSYVR